MTAPVDLAKVYGCPLPPANLADRKMPVCELQLASTPLLRIHRSVYDPIYYNRRSSGGDQFRFDAAGDEFGVGGRTGGVPGHDADARVRRRRKAAGSRTARHAVVASASAPRPPTRPT